MNLNRKIKINKKIYKYININIFYNKFNIILKLLMLLIIKYIILKINLFKNI